MKTFTFKQFTIYQEKSAMKISTDSVLLGAWIQHKNPATILDIGTGTGILSLMAAQKFKNSKIIAIEIDNDSFNEAVNNFNKSQWNNRIKIHNTDFFLYAQQTKTKFDLIITNPPFFENQLLPKDEKKKKAKHTNLLPFDKLIKTCPKLLSNNGLFSLIIPKQEEKNIIHLCSQNLLFLKRRMTIFPNEKKQANRVLLEFSKTINPVEEEKIIIRKNNLYTKEYLQLTKDFYLFA